MALKLTIDIPDDLAARLAERAAAANTTPEALVVERLADAPWLQPGYGSLQRLAGTFRFAAPDASVRTDEYLADEYLDPHETKPDAP